MPKPVIITADSASDLPLGLRAELGIHFLPLHVRVEDKTGRDCVDIFPEEIWEAFRARGSLPKTAAPSIAEYQEFFESFTNTGADVVHIALGSMFSSCHRVACLAAEEIGAGKVHIVDSMNFCTGSGMLCVQGARLRDAGLGAAEIAGRLRDLRGKVRAIYLLDGIDFLSKSGRCPSIVAMCAALFNIHPSVTIDGATGGIVVGKKYRGKSAGAAESWLRDSIRKFRETCDPALCFFMHTPEMPPEQYEPMNRIAAQALGDAGRLIMDTVGCMVISHVGGNCYALVGMEK